MKFLWTIRTCLMIRVSPFLKKFYLISYYRVYIGYPSIETPVSAASPFPSPPADSPSQKPPGPKGSVTNSTPYTTTTAATAGTTRSRSSFSSLVRV